MCVCVCVCVYGVAVSYVRVGLLGHSDRFSLGIRSSLVSRIRL